MEEVTANTIQEFFVCDNFMSETEKPAIVFLWPEMKYNSNLNIDKVFFK